VVLFRCVPLPPNGAAREASPARQPTPPSVREIRVPCAGKLQPEHFLKAFEQGVDLVLVATCGDGRCRYLEGQRRVQRRIDYVKDILNDIGLGGERLALVQPAPDGGEGDLAQAVAMALVSLQPSPLSTRMNLRGG
jgi:coenzyme F420-reducing hydrogenase delta subunit